MKARAVLLDRDGVINVDSPDYILTPEQWQPISGSLRAIARLTAAGIPIALISNQSALARGMLNQQTFDAIHARMMTMIEAAGGHLEHVFYCPHGPDDGCDCRKPLPGMIQSALVALGMQDMPQQVVMIGDSLRDVQSALAAGITPILVQSGYGDAPSIAAKARAIDANIAVFKDLQMAVDALLESS